MKPALKLCLGSFSITLIGVFVVNLPADHIRVMTERLGHLLRDPPTQFAILGVAPVELLAISVPVLPAVFHGAQSLRILLCKPSWRCGRWRAHHNRDVMPLRCTHGVLEPFQMKLAL